MDDKNPQINKRGPGRPRATEPTNRIQYSLRQSTYEEIITWWRDGKLSKTLAGTVEFMITEWLDANRNALPLMEEASRIQEAAQRQKAGRNMRLNIAKLANNRSRKGVDAGKVLTMIEGREIQ